MTSINHLSSFDFEMMAQALRLAARGQKTCMPNPAVGCVVVKNGRVLGEGWHELAGEDHAEINALKSIGKLSHGATAYVTLEPCSYHGRTPPCVDALVVAGIARVVYGMTDPNPKVSGSGLSKLEKAGILVEGPLLELQAQQLNRGYIKRHKCNQPWVTIKLAMSLDGRTAMGDGESKWITGFHARQDVQRLRAKHCAIITGIGTVLQDNPSLTVRYEEIDRSDGLPNEKRDSSGKLSLKQPLRVVVDSKLNTPVDAKILSTTGSVLIASTLISDALGSSKAEIVRVPGNDERVDLSELLKILAERECNNVLVEAGPKLAGAFLQAGLADELVVYVAPKLLGNMARPLFHLPFIHMNQQVELDIIDIGQVGGDLRITARPIKNSAI